MTPREAIQEAVDVQLLAGLHLTAQASGQSFNGVMATAAAFLADAIAASHGTRHQKEILLLELQDFALERLNLILR